MRAGSGRVEPAGIGEEGGGGGQKLLRKQRPALPGNSCSLCVHRHWQWRA